MTPILFLVYAFFSPLLLRIITDTITLTRNSSRSPHPRRVRIRRDSHLSKSLLALPTLHLSTLPLLLIPLRIHKGMVTQRDILVPAPVRVMLMLENVMDLHLRGTETSLSRRLCPRVVRLPAFPREAVTPQKTASRTERMFSETNLILPSADVASELTQGQIGVPNATTARYL